MNSSKMSWFSIGLMAVALLWTAAPQAVAAGRPADTVSTDSSLDEELTVTHKRLGPLSDWAQMKEHSAEYQRLKQKFDPDQGGVSPAAAMANGRNAMLPPGQREPAFFSEARDSPTAPVVQSLEDTITNSK